MREPGNFNSTSLHFRHNIHHRQQPKNATMTEWTRSLSAQVLAVLDANPTDEIAERFTKNFRKQYPDEDLNDLSLFERFTASVTSQDGDIFPAHITCNSLTLFLPSLRLEEVATWRFVRPGILTGGLSNPNRPDLQPRG